MPDFSPAPAWILTSAPRPMSFLTVSGVAATRPSAGSLSAGTAISMKGSGILEALSQPDFSFPVKLRLTGSAAVAEKSAQEESQQGEEDNHASHGVFYSLDKHPVGFFMFLIVHRGMTRRVRLMFSHCTSHYYDFPVTTSPSF